MGNGHPTVPAPALPHRVLVVEGPDVLPAGQDALQTPGGPCSYERVPWDALRARGLDALPADLVMPVAPRESEMALGLFRWLREQPLLVPTLAVLTQDVEGQLLCEVSASVDDFVFWPVRAAEWRQRIVRLLESQRPEAGPVEERLIAEMGMARLVGRHPALLQALERVPLVARTGGPVLLTGETGTGKELCARAIHHLGPRRHFPFIPVDCGALPDHLFENEFFGHARGAFTDARSDQRGLVAMAEGGTLFLDEVDSLSLGAQAKLLRFLQERTYRPLGGDRFVPANVMVLAASNQELEGLVAQQRFRADLFFRVNVLRLHLPPLRDRRDDIPLLASHFVDANCAEMGLGRKTLAPSTVRVLRARDWPGNVRELGNTVRRAVLFSEGPQILPCHVQPASSSAGPSPEDGATFRQARAQALQAFERAFVEDLLRRNAGNITWAARAAHKERRAFGRLVKKYQISRLDS